MSYLIYAYLIIFTIILIGNTMFCIKFHTNLWMVLYELLAGVYLIAVTLVYHYGSIKERINIWMALPIILVITVDFYFSVLDRGQSIKPKDLNIEVSDSEMELGTITSVIFAAPAYVSGSMLLIEKISH
ncbi:MAG: hypothetical protein L3J71_14710 [Victivallaceae bacterium]|nr:hypothetical protein [Victivallaceae bacterium]